MVAVAGLFVGGLASPAAADSDHTLYVSTHGSPTNRGHSCGTATFSSIQDAVDAAPDWGTVIVCPGTYAEDVTVGQPLTLVGKHATIDATGLENAIQVTSSHVTVRGFTLENANGEGLLIGFDAPPPGAAPTNGPPPVLTDELVDHVKAVNNDKGFNGTEQGNCAYPGDCGGGIHLEVVSWSRVSDSIVTGNADGILLTDDYGPNSHNVIEGNRVTDNLTECGIVLPSHNGGAVSFSVTPATGTTPTAITLTGRNPAVGGVFDNVVRDNVVLRNGTAPSLLGGGSGSGIGIFAPFPGTGAYDNVVEDNYMAGNGMAGFTIHAHMPDPTVYGPNPVGSGEDVNGNKVVDNTFGTNNTGGDGFDGPTGPMDLQTTGIAVYSFSGPVDMTIRDNEIRNNEIGIWLSTIVTAHGLSDNEFHHVTTEVVTG